MPAKTAVSTTALAPIREPVIVEGSKSNPLLIVFTLLAMGVALVGLVLFTLMSQASEMSTSAALRKQDDYADSEAVFPPVAPPPFTNTPSRKKKPSHRMTRSTTKPRRHRHRTTRHLLASHISTNATGTMLAARANHTESSPMTIYGARSASLAGSPAGAESGNVAHGGQSVTSASHVTRGTSLAGSSTGATGGGNGTHDDYSVRSTAYVMSGTSMASSPTGTTGSGNGTPDGDIDTVYIRLEDAFEFKTSVKPTDSRNASEKSVKYSAQEAKTHNNASKTDELPITIEAFYDSLD